jgi:hypothetical protein
METFSYSGGVPIVWVLASFVSAIIFLALFLGYAVPATQAWFHTRMRAKTQMSHVAINRTRLEELVLLSKIGTRTGTTPPEFRTRLRWLEIEHGRNVGEDAGYMLALQEELIEGLGGN